MKIAQYRSVASDTVLICEVTHYMESSSYIRVSEVTEVEFRPVESHDQELAAVRAHREHLAKQLAEINRREMELRAGEHALTCAETLTVGDLL
jgi:hypothetical protein